MTLEHYLSGLVYFLTYAVLLTGILPKAVELITRAVVRGWLEEREAANRRLYGKNWGEVYTDGEDEEQD